MTNSNVLFLSPTLKDEIKKETGARWDWVQNKEYTREGKNILPTTRPGMRPVTSLPQTSVGEREIFWNL